MTASNRFVPGSGAHVEDPLLAKFSGVGAPLPGFPVRSAPKPAPAAPAEDPVAELGRATAMQNQGFISEDEFAYALGVPLLPLLGGLADACRLSLARRLRQ